MKKRNLIVKISSVVVSLVLIAAMALCMASCGKTETPEGVSSPVSTTKEQVKELGQGNTQFKFAVTDADGKVENFVIKTDKTTVGDALLDVELISGSDSEYGLMVDTVNGIKADYNTDKAYWAFYINGEYAQTGVSATEIAADTEYSFVYTKG